MVRFGCSIQTFIFLHTLHVTDYKSLHNCQLVQWNHLLTLRTRLMSSATKITLTTFTVAFLRFITWLTVTPCIYTELPPNWYIFLAVRVFYNLCLNSLVTKWFPPFIRLYQVSHLFNVIAYGSLWPYKPRKGVVFRGFFSSLVCSDFLVEFPIRGREGDEE